MNVRKVLRQLREEPLGEFLEALVLQNPPSLVFEDEINLYQEAYGFYYLTLDRLLPGMSIARRFLNGPYYVWKYGGRYTPSEKNLAEKFHRSKRYLMLDFANFLLYSRILLDRTIALASNFMQGGNIPSFSSFNNHKKFFLRPDNIPYHGHEKYAVYVREQTDWFDKLKLVRDKYLVHTQSLHIKNLGQLNGNEDLSLTVILPRGPKDKPLLKTEWVDINIMDLVYHIQDFLQFFNSYGTEALKKNGNPEQTL